MRLKRFELLTLWFVARYSIQLSYSRTTKLRLDGDPTGIRTPVAAVKGQCPRPLDDGINLKLYLISYSLDNNYDSFNSGGGKRNRTADLLHAMQALYQLSYTPPKEIRILQSKFKPVNPPFENKLNIAYQGFHQSESVNKLFSSNTVVSG
ncbi:MAG: hypothetical protein RL571_2094 [Pseudomonadota bacterium]